MTVIFYVSHEDISKQITNQEHTVGWYIVDDKGSPPTGPFRTQALAKIHLSEQEPVK